MQNSLIPLNNTHLRKTVINVRIFLADKETITFWQLKVLCQSTDCISEIKHLISGLEKLLHQFVHRIVDSSLNPYIILYLSLIDANRAFYEIDCSEYSENPDKLRITLFGERHGDQAGS